MRAILIDPWKRSLETIDITRGNDPAALHELYQFVGEDAIDAAYIRLGESIIVGDHSALADPPLPSYWINGFPERLYGRGVVIGYNKDGSERETRLTVDDISKMITWVPAPK
jgi:hypothetical protein